MVNTLTLFERLFTGPKIHKVVPYTNKELGLRLFRFPRKLKCKFYMHYNPCQYTGEYCENIFKMPKIEILSGIKSRVIKVGWIDPSSSNKTQWYFKIIKTRKPINIIGISVYLKECLVARAIIESIQILHKDEVWLTYTLNKNEIE